VNTIRTLPIRLAPTHGEALDSWLEALAHRSDAPWVDILDAVGLALGRFRTFPWIVNIPVQQIDSVSAATGISAVAVRAMTLAQFDHTPLRTTADRPVVSRVFPWARAGGSRYCPQCLAESGGRWQLTWRLGWSFACLKHACLLADICPECVGTPRVHAIPAHYTPVPGHCARQGSSGGDKSHSRCGCSLMEAVTPQLGRDHPILSAQATIDEIFRSGSADLGRYRGIPQPSVHALADIRHLAAHLLANEKRSSIDEIVGLDQLGVSYNARQAHIRPARRGDWGAEQWAITSRASVAAIGITAGVLAMSKPPASTAQVTRARYRASRPKIEAVALGTAVRPSDELRYRTNNVALSRQELDSSRIAALTRRTPTMLWPAWSLRFALPNCTQRQLRPALSAFLLLVDTRLPLADAAALLDSRLPRQGYSRVLQLLSNRTDWPETRFALGRLADYLVDHDTPIDYQRRRQLNYAALLPDQVWARICRDTCTPAGHPARARIVRYYLYERLSGRPIGDLPSAYVVGETHTKVNNFPLYLNPDLACALAEYCRDFLAQNGICGEPPFWSPPTDVLAGMQLPGADPEDVDISTLLRLTGDAVWSGTRIAKLLKTTLPVVRHLSELAVDTVRWPTDLPQTRVRHGGLKRARSVLAPDDLARRYWQDFRSLRDIAAEVDGVNEGNIKQLAREYGMEVRPPGRISRQVVDRDWLYEQYVVKRRTLQDIGTECGISPSSMARWARRHSIPLRSRGGVSHREHLADQVAADTVPVLIRPALAGVGGWQRLERLAIAAQFPTMTAAARHLSAPGLIGQIERIEAELGFRLFVRAQRGRAMQLTDDGRRVLSAIRTAQHARSRRPSSS